MSNNTRTIRKDRSDEIYPLMVFANSLTLKDKDSDLSYPQDQARLDVPSYPNTNQKMVRWRVLFRRNLFFERKISISCLNGKTAWSPKMSSQRFGIPGFTLPGNN